MGMPKLYIAGPDIFLPNAKEWAEVQRRLCRKYGFEPLHPMDNNLALPENGGIEIADRIYRADIRQVEECDIVIANCNPFRGICMDDGTAYELGYGNALGKPSYGYIRELVSLVSRTVRGYLCHYFKDGIFVDKDGYLVVDDFGTSINLMMQCGMRFRGGMLVEGNFKHCLSVIRADLDEGRLRLA